MIPILSSVGTLSIYYQLPFDQLPTDIQFNSRTGVRKRNVTAQRIPEPEPSGSELEAQR